MIYCAPEDRPRDRWVETKTCRSWKLLITHNYETGLLPSLYSTLGIPAGGSPGAAMRSKIIACEGILAFCVVAMSNSPG